MRSPPLYVGTGDRVLANEDKKKKGEVMTSHHDLSALMVSPWACAVSTVPLFMATDTPFWSWLKAVMLMLRLGNLPCIDKNGDSVARLGLAYMPHSNRTLEDIYNALGAIITDCPRWSPKLIDTVGIPITTMPMRLASAMDDRDPTSQRKVEIAMKMWCTA